MKDQPTFLSTSLPYISKSLMCENIGMLEIEPQVMVTFLEGLRVYSDGQHSRNAERI